MKKFIIGLSVVIYLMIPKYGNACWWGPEGDYYRFWLFEPNVGNNAYLSPFFYSNYQYNETYSYPEEGNVSNLNTEEWYRHFKGKIQREEIHRFLYEMDPASMPADADENEFLKGLRRLKFKEEAEYLLLAKQCEFFYGVYDPWECSGCYSEAEIRDEKLIPEPGTYRSYDYGDYIDDSVAKANPGAAGTPKIDPLADFLKDLEAFRARAKKAEIIQRTAMQLVKVNFYLGNLDAAERIYKADLEKCPDTSYVKNCALIYLATLRTDAMRNIYLAQAYRNLPEKRIRCQKLYLLGILDSTLALTHDPAIIASLRIMESMQNPGEGTAIIKEVYSDFPREELLNMLIVREINKLEDLLYSESAMGIGSAMHGYSKDAPHDHDMERADNLRDVVAGMINDNLRDNAFLFLCQGHIETMMGRYDRANECYAAADTLPKDQNVAAQLILSKLFLRLTEKKTIDTVSEALVYDYLIALEARKDQAKNELRSRLLLYMADRYKQDGQVARAILTYSTSSTFEAYDYLLQHGTPGACEEIVSTILKNNKTFFESYITRSKSAPVEMPGYSQGFEWSVDRVLDYESVLLVREDKLEDACAVLRRVDTAYWSTWPAELFSKDNPFELSIFDGHNPYLVNEVKYNKLTFLETLVRMKADVKKQKGEERAKTLYKIGNAYYSMTWHGKFWIMNERAWSIRDIDPEEEAWVWWMDIPQTPRRDYLGAAKALDYYREAFELTKDKRLAAYAGYMSALCESHSVVFVTNKEAEFEEFEKGYLDSYAERFGSRQYYDDITTDCALQYDFVRWLN